MSSEDKSLDPSDQGPSPLSSAGSPTPSDRRLRSRPRKDAPAAAAVVTPTPTPRPRRKSRSRGRAQADDEDSMDGTDPADPEVPHETGTSELDVEEDLVQPMLCCPGDVQLLSPLFQRSVSEDSAGSSASASENAKTSEKLCAFCYCGEKSLLGQGELKVFGPTPGYVPLHIRNRRGSSEKDDDYHDEDDDFDNEHARSPGQRGRGLKKVSSPDSGLHSSSAPGSTDPFGEEPSRKLWDELGQVGLPDGINVQSLFDPTGQCCAHLRCAAWSDGVCRTEGQVLLYVDKAIDSGSTECCAYCKRLGASIKCCEDGCGRSYHYPCAAAAAGAVQDAKRYTLLCPDHASQALVRSDGEVKCVVCDGPGDLQDLLFCTTCGQHYHGACLDVTATPLKRAGWQCPECKVCLACRNPGDDNQMLVCDMCDKGYHTYCLQPVMDTIPSGGWRCKNCRLCAQCGTRTGGQWSSSGVLCDGCQQQQEPTSSCPLCGRSLAPGTPEDVLTCGGCKRRVHLECERQEKGSDWAAPPEFTCSGCRRTEKSSAQLPLPELPLDSVNPDLFMAVEEEQEQEEDVSLPQDTDGGQREEEPKESPSATAEPVQEIQVTLTLTEGPDDSPSQTTAPALDPAEEPETVAAMETEPEDAPTEQSMSPPTKETTEPPATPEQEPMEVYPSGPDTSDVLESSAEAQEMVGDEEQEKVEVKEEKTAGEDEQQEVMRILPEHDSTPPPVLDGSPAPEMDTTPASDPNSGFSSPLKHSPSLALSPFSTEASPTGATFFPVTPKIGMGKPAISKRKFSPGRPRVKQVRARPSGGSGTSWVYPARSRRWLRLSPRLFPPLLMNRRRSGGWGQQNLGSPPPLIRS
uniref:Uncharacterized protein n=1 Tax=Denticeps clupeoides TaxID=299321 RepID=A0AAY4BYI5_9TELE